MVNKRYINMDGSQLPRDLRRGFAASCFLGLRVRITPGKWISVFCVCCVLWGRVLCYGLITRPEESYRLWCVVCDLETSWTRRPWPVWAAAPKESWGREITNGLCYSRYHLQEKWYCKGKGKLVPLQAWSGPEGSRKLSFPNFVTTAQDGGKVVNLTHRPTLPPGNALGTLFCQRLSRPQCHCAIGGIMSMKNSNDTNWVRTSDLPICSTAP